LFFAITKGKFERRKIIIIRIKLGDFAFIITPGYVKGK